MLEKIISLVSEQLSVRASEIDKNTLLIDDLGADSLDIAEIMKRIEQEFGVSFNEADIVKLKTVGDFAKYAEART